MTPAKKWAEWYTTAPQVVVKSRGNKAQGMVEKTVSLEQANKLRSVFSVVEGLRALRWPPGYKPPGAKEQKRSYNKEET